MMAGKQAMGLGLMLAIAAALIIALGTSAPDPAPASEQEPDAVLADEVAAASEPSRVDYQRLDARITALMADPDMVGLAIGTIESGEVRFLRAYGETLAGSGSPVTPDTVFRWASLSKGIAAALAVSLAEEGTLSLDAPLTSFRTTLTLPGGASRVTVADVLAHRVGIVRNAWDDRLEAGEDPRVLRASLGTLAPFCPPATCHSYQNIAFDAVAEVIETATGSDYADVVTRRLFAPLGMANASHGRTGLETASSWAQPHRRERVPTVVNDAYYRVPAAGGANGSIRDLLRWMKAQLGDAPAVLPPETLAAMHRPIVPTPPRRRQGAMERAVTDAAYGLGWRSFRYAGRTLVGHRGSVDGYGALILFDPVDRSGIAVLWNSNSRLPARLELEFFDMLYGLPFTDWLELEPPPIETVETAPDKQAESG